MNKLKFKRIGILIGLTLIFAIVMQAWRMVSQFEVIQNRLVADVQQSLDNAVENYYAELAKSDVILLGAVGDPTVPSGILERGLLLKLRFAFDHYINLRPTKLLPGIISPLAKPGDIDFVVVREGTEGSYVGNGGAIRVGSDQEIANAQQQIKEQAQKIEKNLQLLIIPIS